MEPAEAAGLGADRPVRSTRRAGRARIRPGVHPGVCVRRGVLRRIRAAVDGAAAVFAGVREEAAFVDAGVDARRGRVVHRAALGKNHVSSSVFLHREPFAVTATADGGVRDKSSDTEENDC